MVIKNVIYPFGKFKKLLFELTRRRNKILCYWKAMSLIIIIKKKKKMKMKNKEKSFQLELEQEESITNLLIEYTKSNYNEIIKEEK